MCDNVNLCITGDAEKAPTEKRDFAYESQMLEEKFRVLSYDVDRFLNGRNSIQRTEKFLKKEHY